MSVETAVPAAPAQRDDPSWVGALAGVLAMVAGLAAAELVVGLRSGAWVSPVVSVGDRVVDNVPAPVKEWAISAFGTADKAVLLAGVGLLLAALAAFIGVQALRRGPVAAVVGVGAVALVGVLASLGRGGDGSGGVVPSLVAGVVATATLVLLVQRWHRTADTAEAAPASWRRPWAPAHGGRSSAPLRRSVQARSSSGRPDAGSANAASRPPNASPPCSPAPALRCRRCPPERTSRCAG